MSTKTEGVAAATIDRTEGPVSKDTLTITDNRTGKSYEVPIQDGTIKAIDLRQIKVAADDFGLMTYDPGFMNTASCKSRITFIDGDKGILNYRGYPIEQLAEQSNYLETAYLLLNGELPTKAQYDDWVDKVTTHTFVHENVKELMAGFRYDAHPMGMLASTVAALSTFYPDAKRVRDREERGRHIYRLIAKIPTLAAFAYRHSMGLPYVYPDNELSYSGNFLQMMFKMSELKYKVNPVLEKALDVLFILHADHEQNCSTSAMRGIGSSEADPYCAAAGAIAALYGPLHGGANEAVLRMLQEIGSKDKVPAFIKDVKESAATCASWASATASTRTTTRARRSSRRWPTRSSRSRAATRCSTSRSSSSGSPSRTTTSSSASSTRTWTSTRASSTRRWASRRTCSRSSSRSRGCPAGSRSGRR